MKLYCRKSLHMFALVLAFILALDACIAVNRWWLEEGFLAYLRNLAVMVSGFAFFTLLASRSKNELVGLAFLCVAIYFICNYEIGGPSKYYLTPFEPILGLEPTFAPGDLTHLNYRKAMAICTSVLAASVLAVSRARRRNVLSTTNLQSGSACIRHDDN